MDVEGMATGGREEASDTEEEVEAEDLEATEREEEEIWGIAVEELGLVLCTELEEDEAYIKDPWTGTYMQIHLPHGRDHGRDIFKPVPSQPSSQAPANWKPSSGQ